MRCAEKLVVESGGVAVSSRGGNESLGPPDGGTILAQPVNACRCRMVMNAARNKKMLLSGFANIKANIIAF